MKCSHQILSEWLTVLLPSGCTALKLFPILSPASCHSRRNISSCRPGEILELQTKVREDFTMFSHLRHYVKQAVSRHEI